MGPRPAEPGFVVERPLASGPPSTSTGSRSPVGIMRLSSWSRSRTGISTSHSARSSPRKAEIGVIAERDRHRHVTRSVDLVAIVRVPALARCPPTAPGVGRERRQQLLVGGEVERRGQDAAIRPRPCLLLPATLGCREQSVDREPPGNGDSGRRGRPDIDLPAGDREPRPRNAIGPRMRSGMPIVDRSSMYVRRPPRWPSSSSPRWRSEHPTMPALGTNAASRPASVASVSAPTPSTVRLAIISLPQSEGTGR